MSREVQSQLLSELAKAHQEWKESVERDVKINMDHTNPHDPVSGETDYGVHYADRSASTEQEKIFQEKIAPILDKLSKL